jgi:hypothetical protein
MVCDGQTHKAVIHDEGESWYEPPGCHHVRCENAGDDEAIFVANFVIETRTIGELGIAALWSRLMQRKSRGERGDAAEDVEQQERGHRRFYRLLASTAFCLDPESAGNFLCGHIALDFK